MPCRIDCFSTTYRRKLAAATAAATAVIAAAITVAIPAYTVNAFIRRAGNVRGLRARTERVNQRACLRVLRQLRRELRVLRLQARNLFLREEVENCVRAVALAVDNIARAGVDGVRDVAGVLRHVVIHAVDCALRLAAAVCKLIPDLRKAFLVCVLRLQNRGIHAAKTLAKRLLNARLTEFKVVKRRKRCVLRKTYCNVVARRNLAELVVQVPVSATAIAAKAPAVITKQRKKHDNPQPIGAPCAAPAVVVALTNSETACQSVRIIIHQIILL